MKEKIIYVSVFLVAFLITTGGIIYMNNNYRDIFEFNFTPVQKVKKDNLANKNLNGSPSLKDLKNMIQTEFKNYFIDSLRSAYGNRHRNTMVAVEHKDSSLSDSLKSLKQIINKIDHQLAVQESKNQNVKIAEQKEKVQKDSAYIKWTHQTAKLYEAMDASKAAKIIESYSDNVARDILYSMRQKKAAEILSELNPQTANRITQAKSNAF